MARGIASLALLLVAVAVLPPQVAAGGQFQVSTEMVGTGTLRVTITEPGGPLQQECTLKSVPVEIRFTKLDVTFYDGYAWLGVPALGLCASAETVPEVSAYYSRCTVASAALACRTFFDCLPSWCEGELRVARDGSFRADLETVTYRADGSRTGYAFVLTGTVAIVPVVTEDPDALLEALTPSASDLPGWDAVGDLPSGGKLQCPVRESLEYQWGPAVECLPDFPYQGKLADLM